MRLLGIQLISGGCGSPGDHGLHDARYLPGDDLVGTVADALLAGYLAAASLE